MWTSTETPLLDIVRGRDPNRAPREYSIRRRDRNYGVPESHGQKRATIESLSSINRGSVSNHTKVESDRFTDEWPLGGKADGGIQHTVEFDIIHERRYSES